MSKLHILKPVLAALFAVAATFCFIFELNRLDSGREDKSAQQLERALRRAIAAEYAINNAYPGSLNEIIAKYGIQADYGKYNIFYMPIAENLPPVLDIVKKEADNS